MTQGSDRGAVGARGGATAVADILFVASMLLVFVIFAFGVVSLQLCFVACYRRRAQASSSQSGRRRRGGGTVFSGGGGSTQNRVGDPEAPRSPPATVYRAAARSKDEQCAVCLAGLEDGEEARFMPCRHGFHAQCVGTWLAVASRPTCPLCRINVARHGGVAPAPASSLPPVPPEPANYTTNLPAARVSNHGVVTVPRAHPPAPRLS